MISIIVCSINQEFYYRFVESVNQTIGVQFEIIKIDNKIDKLSIAQAYKKGSSLAKYEYLVFVHEDVVFHTMNWGTNLISNFGSLHNPGVIGIAGNSYQPISPSDWWVSKKEFRHFNYIKNGRNRSENSGELMSSGDHKPRKVYCLDGVFLALKNSVFKEAKFDESLEGFHGYDTSLSLRVSKNYLNYFIPNILIEHFSHGNITNYYWFNTLIASRDFQVSKMEVDINMEYLSFKRFLIKSIKYKINLF